MFDLRAPEMEMGGEKGKGGREERGGGKGERGEVRGQLMSFSRRPNDV